MKTQCPHCKAIFNAPDQYEGKKAKCAKCKQPFVVSPISTHTKPSEKAIPPTKKENEIAPQPAHTNHEQVVTRVPKAPAAPPKVENVINVNTQKAKGMNGLGIASLVLGIITCLSCWIPFVGCFLIPIGLLGILFGIIGFFIALIGRKSGIGMPLSGVVVCVVSVAIAIGMTGAASAALEETLNEISAEMDSSLSPPSAPAAATNTVKPKANNELQEKKSYLKNIDIYEFDAKYFETYDGQTPGVQLKIRNNGDRTLSKIKIVVYFKDSRNQVIAEDNFYPVNTDSFSSDFHKPLKPNYIWQMPEGKFLPAESVPSEWQEGNVSYAIDNIEFVN